MAEPRCIHGAFSGDGICGRPTVSPDFRRCENHQPPPRTERTRVEHHYATELVEEQRLCQPKPTVHVSLTETTTTTTHHEDGSETIHTTQPRRVASWTHTPEEQQP